VKRLISSFAFWHRIVYRTVTISEMGPQEPKDVTRDTARDLSALVGELAALKADAIHWLTDPEYAALRHHLEAAHAAAEAALVEARAVFEENGPTG